MPGRGEGRSPAGRRQPVYARVRAKQHQAAIRLWIPDYFDAHSNASAFAWNDGKSSTVAGLNGWQIPELNKATSPRWRSRTRRNASTCTKRCRKPCCSIRHTSLLTGKTQIVVRDNVKGYQQG